jgi:hypothetical protein
MTDRQVLGLALIRPFSFFTFLAPTHITTNNYYKQAVSFTSVRHQGCLEGVVVYWIIFTSLLRRPL